MGSERYGYVKRKRCLKADGPAEKGTTAFSIAVEGGETFAGSVSP